MIVLQAVASFVLLLVFEAEAVEVDLDKPRLIFSNYTNGLLAIDTTSMSATVGAGAVLAALLVVIYFLSSQPALAHHQSLYQSRGFRGLGAGTDLLTLFSVASDLYSKLEYDDVTCQKKIICEFMKDPEIFGSEVHSMKSSVEMVTSYLQLWGVPYVTEIRDAASLNDKSGKSCAERHPECEDISLKNSYTKSVEKVKEVQSQLNRPHTTPTPQQEEKKEEQEEQDQQDSESEYEYEYYDKK